MNVISPFADVPSDLQSSVIIQLATIKSARSSLTKIETAAALGLEVLDQASEHRDTVALEGVRQVFAWLSASLAN
jgi:hypothetical protein